MGRAAIEHHLWLLGRAYEDDDEHSLLANLASVRDEDWERLAEGGSRSITEIVRHAAAAKYAYESNAFGDASISWDVAVDMSVGLNRARLMAHLDIAHRRVVASVDALTDDSELLVERRAHWGGLRETRLLLSTLLVHDLYHAGEINHLRSLLQDTDRWAGGF